MQALWVSKMPHGCRQAHCAKKSLGAPGQKLTSSPTLCSVLEKWEMILWRPGKNKIPWNLGNNHFKEMNRRWNAGEIVPTISSFVSIRSTVQTFTLESRVLCCRFSVTCPSGFLLHSCHLSCPCRIFLCLSLFGRQHRLPLNLHRLCFPQSPRVMH